MNEHKVSGCVDIVFSQTTPTPTPEHFRAGRSGSLHIENQNEICR